MPDLVDTAINAGTFSTLVAAVTAAGLDTTLKGSGPFTVFAPTDDAFSKLPSGTVEALLSIKELFVRFKELVSSHIQSLKCNSTGHFRLF